jgi:hypothetical protein
MKFQISYDENGEPYYVFTDNGFMQTSRAFDPKEDGWMLNQLDPRDFPAIQTGRDMEFLVAEVNSLRRKLFQQEAFTESYRKASGFGGP